MLEWFSSPKNSSRIKIGKDLLPLKIETDQIEQVLINLIPFKTDQPMPNYSRMVK